MDLATMRSSFVDIVAAPASAWPDGRIFQQHFPISRKVFDQGKRGAANGAGIRPNCAGEHF